MSSIYIYDPLCNDKFTDSILVFYLFPIRIRNLSWQHFATRYQDELLQCKLDDQTNSTESSSNSVHLLVNGVQSFARRYENLSTAKFIYLKTFLFTNDEKGRRMASGLAERAEAGIPVVLQYDVKGSIESTEVVKDMLKQATPSNPFGEKSIIQKMTQF